MIAVERPVLEHSGWQARLELGFARAASRTVLRRRVHSGPLRVQRPFYPEGEGVCHVYLLHPPGGLVGGDSLTVDVCVEGGAHALLTTPAATKYYRTNGLWGTQVNTLRVAAGSVCEWLPQETIVFGGALATSRTRVELEGDARFAGWELTCLGRPASGDAYAVGSYRTHFEVWRDGLPLFIDRGVFEGTDRVLDASWGLRGRPVFGTFVLAAASPELVAALREVVKPEQPRDLFSVTALRDVTVCRYLGDSSQRGLSSFQRAWQVVRPVLCSRPASTSRGRCRFVASSIWL